MEGCRIGEVARESYYDVPRKILRMTFYTKNVSEKTLHVMTYTCTKSIICVAHKKGQALTPRMQQTNKQTII